VLLPLFKRIVAGHKKSRPENGRLSFRIADYARLDGLLPRQVCKPITLKAEAFEC
jgi:hypothetical protein